MIKQHFRMFAAYNRWANARLFDAAAALDPGEYKRDCGAFFGSMRGTLNHILIADRIWMKRFTGEGNHPGRLDAIPYPALDELRSEREGEDARIIDWVEGLGEDDLKGSFNYITITDKKAITQRLGPAMAHFFNHQTHHRGHAHMILSILGQAPPPLDLLYFHRSPEGKAFA